MKSIIFLFLHCIKAWPVKNMPFVILYQCNINAHCAVLSVICLYLYFRMPLVCLRMCSIFVFVRALPTLYCALDFARGKKRRSQLREFLVETCLYLSGGPVELVNCVSVDILITIVIMITPVKCEHADILIGIIAIIIIFSIILISFYRNRTQSYNICSVYFLPHCLRENSRQKFYDILNLCKSNFL